jgi:hypothetical protein
MTPPFSVTATPHFERVFRKLLAGHPELRGIRERVGEILRSDPSNHSRMHHIKKLVAVPPSAKASGAWLWAVSGFAMTSTAKKWCSSIVASGGKRPTANPEKWLTCTTPPFSPQLDSSESVETEDRPNHRTLLICSVASYTRSLLPRRSSAS